LISRRYGSKTRAPSIAICRQLGRLAGLRWSPPPVSSTLRLQGLLRASPGFENLTILEPPGRERGPGVGRASKSLGWFSGRFWWFLSNFILRAAFGENPPPEIAGKSWRNVRGQLEHSSGIFTSALMFRSPHFGESHILGGTRNQFPRIYTPLFFASPRPWHMPGDPGFVARRIGLKLV